MAVNFYLEKRTDKAGDAPIRVSISICGVRLVTSTGYSINPTKWDCKKQKVKQGCSNSKGITYTTVNAHLNAIDSFFIEYENTSRKEDIKTTQENVKNIFKANFSLSKKNIEPIIIPQEQEKSLLDYFDEFIKDSGAANDWAKATYAKLGTVRSHIATFDPNPTFDSFDEEGLTNYVSYLREKDMRNTSVAKQLRFLKWFLRWTTSKGYNKNIDYISFKPKFKTTEKKVIFLSWDELMTVFNFDIPEHKNYLARVRDVFCFCCFTSLRYSDVYNLKRSDIVGNTIHITTIKTSDSLIIDLNKYSRAILDKYTDSIFEGNKALPVISNQKSNDYLKELGKLCEINQPQTMVYFKGNKRIEETYPKYELLGTHAGRRTFICNALSLGIPVQVVMKWTGHSDYKAMKPYIDIADNIKAKAMNKFDEI